MQIRFVCVMYVCTVHNFAKSDNGIKYSKVYNLSQFWQIKLRLSDNERLEKDKYKYTIST